MRIFTYYAPVPDINGSDELALISLWLDAWRAAGFDPFVISGWTAERWPGYEAFAAKARRFFSSNPAGYDLACFIRWWIIGQIGDEFSVMADYDCFPNVNRAPLRTYRLSVAETPCNYLEAFMGWKEPAIASRCLTVWQGHVPSLVSGPKENFSEMANLFMTRPVIENQHTSDMVMVADMGYEWLRKIHVVKSYGEAGWEKAPVIHFPNVSMNNLKPKWRHIPSLLREKVKS